MNIIFKPRNFVSYTYSIPEIASWIIRRSHANQLLKLTLLKEYGNKVTAVSNSSFDP